MNPTPDLILASASPRDGSCSNDRSGCCGSNPWTWMRRQRRTRRRALCPAPGGRERRCGVGQIGSCRLPPCPSLTADTVVVLGDDILGKPANQDEAAAMLRRLAGRRHEVMTAYRVHSGGRTVERVVSTGVTFRSLDPAELRAYLDSGEWQGKPAPTPIPGHRRGLRHRSARVHSPTWSGCRWLNHRRPARTGGPSRLPTAGLGGMCPVSRADDIAANLRDVRARIAQAEARTSARGQRAPGGGQQDRARDGYSGGAGRWPAGFWRKLRGRSSATKRGEVEAAAPAAVCPGHAGTSSARCRTNKVKTSPGRRPDSFDRGGRRAGRDRTTRGRDGANGATGLPHPGQRCRRDTEARIEAAALPALLASFAQLAHLTLHWFDGHAPV